MNYSQELIDMLKPTKKIRVFVRQNSPKNEIRHIRAIVDDEYIVYKTYSKIKQRWRYNIEWMYQFSLEFEQGWLTSV